MQGPAAAGGAGAPPARAGPLQSQDPGPDLRRWQAAARVGPRQPLIRRTTCMVSPRRLRGQSDLTVSRIDAMTLDGARSELSGGTSEQVKRVLEDFAKALGAAR